MQDVLSVREVVDVVLARNALSNQVAELSERHNRDAAEMRSMQRQLHDQQVGLHSPNAACWSSGARAATPETWQMTLYALFGLDG